MINVSFAGTDELVLEAISAKVEDVGLAVAGELDVQDDLMVSYIVSEELHGQILNQRSGKLAGSIRKIPAVQDGSSIIGQVEGAGGTAWYGRGFEEAGFAPHDIFPVNAKALRFMGSDGWVFAKVVHHPGSPPRPFMAPALAARTPAIIAGIEEAIGEVLAK